MNTARECIWSEAGLIDYQLCRFNFACDTCDIHKNISSPEIHSHPSSGLDETRILLHTIQGKFHAGCQYFSCHLWSLKSGDSKIRVGVDTFLINLFGNISEIILRPVGSKIDPGTTFSWIVYPFGILNLKLPFEGTVSAINPDTRRDKFAFGLFLEYDHLKRWLIELEIANPPGLQSFYLTRDEYIELVNSDIEKVRVFTEPSSKNKGSDAALSLCPRKDLPELVRQIGRNNHQFH